METSGAFAGHLTPSPSIAMAVFYIDRSRAEPIAVAGHPLCQEAAALRRRKRNTVSGLVSVGITPRRARMGLRSDVRRFASICITQALGHLPAQKVVAVMATAHVSARLSPLLTSLTLVNGRLTHIVREIFRQFGTAIADLDEATRRRHTTTQAERRPIMGTNVGTISTTFTVSWRRQP